MSASLVARAAVLAAAALAAVVLLTGGDDRYRLELRLANAGGLKNGSPVTVGGVRVGTATVSVDTKADQAVVALHIDKQHEPVGRDTRAMIVAQNLLGQKQVQLTTGTTSDPAPSGYVVPAGHVTQGTDLDQVLDVLDADTRTRLAIFVNEAGTAFTGRKADFNRFLRDIAPAIHNADVVVGQLAEDNASLGRLVQTSDRYVAEVTARRKDVVRLVDRVGQAAVTTSTKRTQLRQTLAEAPGALRTLRSFLAELQATTKPLGPAARQLSAVAAPLRQTLDQVGPFTAAATPALRSATGLAPTLERLAREATPVLRRAVPTTAALRRTTVTDLPPIFGLSDRSLDNILTLVQSWAGAIQFRDGLGHIFRGEASVAPDALASVVERLAPAPPATRSTGRREQRRSGGSDTAGRPGAPAGTPAPAPTVRLPGLPPITLPAAGTGLGGLLERLTGSSAPKRQAPQNAADLLDFLLGT